MSPRRLLASRFLRDSTTLQVGALCLAAGNLAGVVALTHVLGAHNQGDFYLAVATYSFLWFLTGLGLTPVAISRIAQASGRDDSEGVAAWLAYLGKVTALLGVATFLFAWFVLPFAARTWLGESVGDPDRIARNAAILCAIPLVEVPRLVAVSGLTGMRRMASVARVENGHEASRVLLVVVGALATGDARGCVIGMLLASLLGSGLGIEAWIREAHAGHLPGPRAVVAAHGRLPWTAGLREGLQMGVVRNINIVTAQVFPALILGRFGTPSWVAYLRTAQRLTDIARMLTQGISRTALPALSELRGPAHHARLRHVYWRASLLSGICVGAALAVGLILAPTILERLLPRDYADPVWRCLLILSPGVLIMGFSAVNDTFYLVTENLRIVIALSFAGLIVNTSVMVILASILPTTGVAYGLSFTFAWSLLYVGYAAWWFRRNVPAVA